MRADARSRNVEKQRRRREEKEQRGDAEGAGTIGESRKIAIPDEMEFWYFIHDAVCAAREFERETRAWYARSVRPSLHARVSTLLPPAAVAAHRHTYVFYVRMCNPKDCK